MAVNKVEANGETLIDLTNDTVTADTLVEGRTAHLASGEQVTGTFKPVTGVKGNAESAYRVGNVNLTPANIGLGNVNNTSDANKPISTATQAALNGKVNKSGDTMTGTLTHQASPVYLKATNLDLNGDNPSAFAWGNSELNFLDKEGRRACFLNIGRRNNGGTQVALSAEARNAENTADVYNQINIRVDRDGTCSYSLSDPSAFRSAINAASKDQVNYNTNNGVKNLLSTEWFVTNPLVSQQGTVESYDVETGSITGFASASLTGSYLGINIAVDKMNNVLENGKTYILSWTVDSMETNAGILGMRRNDNHSYSVGGFANITRTGNYSVSYTHNSSIPVIFSLCINTTGLSTDKRIAISNLMLREAAIEDSTFEPYAKSNAELTADIPLTIHIDYRNIDVPTCDSTYNECLSALESGRAVIAMIQITSKLMRTCFFGLDTDTKIICGEIPNGNTTYDFDWRAGEDCPSIGISS